LPRLVGELSRVAAGAARTHEKGRTPCGLSIGIGGALRPASTQRMPQLPFFLVNTGTSTSLRRSPFLAALE
jgi:hypothetical protein